MSRRGAGEGSVYKRESDDRWIATIELPPLADGKRRRKTVSGRTKQEALKKQDAVKREFGVHGDLPTSSMPLSKWMDYWLSDIAPAEVRVRTLDGYKSLNSLHVEPHIGKVALDKVTVGHVRQTVKRLDDRPSTSLKVYYLLRGALGAALMESHITYNPALKMKPPKVADAALEALTPDEMVKVMGSVIERDDPLAALWLTYMLTGARRGELLGLRWEDVTDEIDLSWQMQVIPAGADFPSWQEHEHVQGGLYRTRPKTAKGERIIPVMEPLKSFLDAHRAQTGGVGWVFTRDGEPLHPDWITKQWPLVIAHAGITKKIRLHDVRHSTVDLLYAVGVSEAVIQEIVGHASAAMTRKYRSKGQRPELVKAMTALGQALMPAVAQ